MNDLTVGKKQSLNGSKPSKKNWEPFSSKLSRKRNTEELSLRRNKDGSESSSVRISSTRAMECKSVHSSDIGKPSTIAMSRSRRSIKPNPKYLGADIITPRYLGALVNDQHEFDQSLDVSVHAKKKKNDFTDKELLLSDSSTEIDFKESLLKIRKTRGRPRKAANTREYEFSKSGNSKCTPPESELRKPHLKLQPIKVEKAPSPRSDTNELRDSTHQKSAKVFSQQSSVKKKEKPAHMQSESIGKAKMETPTFTIVNINDIINQKDPLPSSRKFTSRRKRCLDENEITEPEEMFNPKEGTPHQVNDKEVIPKPLHKMQRIKMQDPAGAKPRILNSELGLKSKEMKPLMNMVDDMPAYSNEKVDTRSDLMPSKPWENVSNFTFVATKKASGKEAEKAGAFISHKENKFSELASVQGERDKDKVAFLNWFILKSPINPKQKVEQKVSIPLASVVAKIKEIALPSPKWKIKIGTFNAMRLNDAAHFNTEESPHEEYKQQLTYIIFRRERQRDCNQKIFDRLLAIKSQAYFMKINGHQANFIESPSILSTTDEIEVILNILDVADLRHSEVFIMSN